MNCFTQLFANLVFYTTKYVSHTSKVTLKSIPTTPLTNADIELIQSKFTAKKIRKGQYILQEGEICRSTAFIVKGAMRQYSVDDKGVEHIIQLSIENWWSLDRESFLTLDPSRYNIDAWEDTTVFGAPEKQTILIIWSTYPLWWKC